MLVEENMLADFRDENGLCQLKPDFGPASRHADFLASLTEAMKRPALWRDGSLKPAHTWEYFEALSDRADLDVVALLAFTELVPVLPMTRRWMAFQHQAGGHACAQVALIGTVLDPKPAIKSAFTDIARKNYHACGGWFEGPEIDEETTQGYLADLMKCGLGCGEGARSELRESLYPVDATPEALAICFENVADLVHLAHHPTAKPMILFLSANSD